VERAARPAPKFSRIPTDDYGGASSCRIIDAIFIFRNFACWRHRAGPAGLADALHLSGEARYSDFDYAKLNAKRSYNIFRKWHDGSNGILFRARPCADALFGRRFPVRWRLSPARP
jgi:hypothetical protein